MIDAVADGFGKFGKILSRVRQEFMQRRIEQVIVTGSPAITSNIS